METKRSLLSRVILIAVDRDINILKFDSVKLKVVFSFKDCVKIEINATTPEELLEKLKTFEYGTV